MELWRTKPRMPKEGSETLHSTVSFHFDDDPTPVYDAVQLLKTWPQGHVFNLNDYRCFADEEPRRWIRLGRFTTYEIVFENPTVSRKHATLRRNQYTGRLHIYDTDSRNGTFVDRHEVVGGDGWDQPGIEVFSGSLVQLGGMLLLACGNKGLAQLPRVSGETVGEVIDRAIEIHGGERKAAIAWGIDRAKLRKLRNDPELRGPR